MLRVFYLFCWNKATVINEDANFILCPFLWTEKCNLNASSSRRDSSVLTDTPSHRAKLLAWLKARRSNRQK